MQLYHKFIEKTNKLKEEKYINALNHAMLPLCLKDSSC